MVPKEASGPQRSRRPNGLLSVAECIGSRIEFLLVVGLVSKSCVLLKKKLVSLAWAKKCNCTDLLHWDIAHRLESNICLQCQQQL